MDKIMVKGSSFVDSSGRERIFNGINLVFKGEDVEGCARKNYYPDWDEKLFAKLQAKGINLVRLGLIWDAVEPLPGQYDDKYLDYMAGIADKLKRYDISFYLDMHQDLYSASYGDGAPDWATVSDSYKYKPAKVIWAEGYFFNKAVQRSFDNFWANTPVLGKGLQDHYADMWKYVAVKFKDKENLIGFDIMNEPYPGTDGGKIFKEIVKSGAKTILSKKVNKKETVKRILNGDFVTEALAVIDDRDVFKSCTKGGEMLVINFDVTKYYPFFKKISEAIREVCEDKIIIMENCYYSNTNIPCKTPRLKYDNGEKESQLAFAPHGYDLTVDSVYTNTASNNRVDTIFDEHKVTQERLGVPVIVGEWGGMVPGSDEYPHLEYLLSKYDGNKWSQTYWAYFKGFEDTKIMDIISRPYPVAVPGEIESYCYDRKNNIFTLDFVTDSARGKKVNIYSPAEPFDIISDGKYTINKINDKGGYMIIVNHVKGKNKISFKIGS